MSNKEVVSLEGVVKKVTQVSNKWCTLLFEGSKERSRASIKGRLFEGSIGLKGGSMVYFIEGRIVGRSPTLTNLEDNHGFIEYISIHMKHFGETQSKAMRAYAQSGQYHSTVEIHDF